MTDSPGSDPSDDDIGPEFFRDMRELMATLPPNKDHRLIVLIKASIDRGARTRARLLGIAQKLGFKRGHFMPILNKNSGKIQARHLWHLDDNGRYSNYE